MRSINHTDRCRESLSARRRAKLPCILVILTTVFCFAGNAAGSTLLSASTTTISFGNVAVGELSTQTITLKNTGTTSTTISQVKESEASFSLSGLSLPLTLAAGNSTTLAVSFKPTAAGTASGRIQIVSDATNSPAQISLSGTGVTRLLSVSPLNLSFGNVNVGSSSTMLVTLTNAGTGSVTVSQATLTGAGFSTSGLSLPLILAPGTNAVFNVVFAPSTTGTFNGSVALSTNSSNSPGAISLSGTGITTLLSAGPLNLGFGNVNVGSNGTLLVTLSNTGTSSVTVSQAAVTGTGFSTSGLSLPLTLTSGTIATFNVVFAPTTTGTFTGSISVASNATNSPTILTLSGTGCTPTLLLSASPRSYSFGNVAVGSSGTQIATLTNTGTGSVTLSQVRVAGTGFSTNGLSLPLTLTSGANAVFNVVFTPATAGTVSGSVAVGSNATNSPTMLTLSGPGTSTALFLSANPLSTSFGSVNVGSSSILPVTLTNTGTSSVTVSQMTVAGAGFSTSGLSLPLTLTSGANAAFNVVFDPTTTGAFSGSISVTSNATNSPNTISLSGTGINSPGQTSACAGTAIAQAPIDVTAELSQVGAGVTVTQMTNEQENWNTYADVPAYSAVAKIMTYNSYPFGPPDSVTTANLDGTNPQTISGSQQGDENYVTVDGKFVYYQGQNPNQSADIYAVPISQTGSCQQIRLTNLNWSPTSGSPQGSLVISTSSIDPTTGKNVIAYAGDPLLHRTLDDGTALPTVTLGDPENGNVFHRMRLNPKFSNIIWYKRDQPSPDPGGVAEPEIWLVDLNSPNTVYSVAGTTPVDHASWSPDGTQIGYHINGVWYLANVVNSDGTFNLSSYSGTGFTSTKIGPPQGFVADACYCTWAPDGSVYACTGGSVPGSPIYLMSLDGTKTKYLAATDTTGKVDAGIPKAQFLDMQHIMFSSDRSATPQIYIITGFTTTFP